MRVSVLTSVRVHCIKMCTVQNDLFALQIFSHRIAVSFFVSSCCSHELHNVLAKSVQLLNYFCL